MVLGQLKRQIISSALSLSPSLSFPLLRLFSRPARHPRQSENLRLLPLDVRGGRLQRLPSPPWRPRKAARTFPSALPLDPPGRRPRRQGEEERKQGASRRALGGSIRRSGGGSGGSGGRGVRRGSLRRGLLLGLELFRLPVVVAVAEGGKKCENFSTTQKFLDSPSITFRRRRILLSLQFSSVSFFPLRSRDPRQKATAVVLAAEKKKGERRKRLRSERKEKNGDVAKPRRRRRRSSSPYRSSRSSAPPPRAAPARALHPVPRRRGPRGQPRRALSARSAPPRLRRRQHRQFFEPHGLPLRRGLAPLCRGARGTVERNGAKRVPDCQ